MNIYIAGPMQGIPKFNYPMFDRVAQKLREKGHHVISPAEMDDEKTREVAMASEDGAFVDGRINGSTWSDFLSRDVKVVTDHADAICLLPGWVKSKGAKLEAYVALINGHKLFEWENEGLVRVRPGWVWLGIKPEETYQ